MPKSFGGRESCEDTNPQTMSVAGVGEQMLRMKLSLEWLLN